MSFSPKRQRAQERVLNLRKYMAQVRLPPLDEDYGHDTVFPSSGDNKTRQPISLQMHRRLEAVQCLDSIIRGSLESWLHDVIPNEEIWTVEPCPETKECLAIPVPLPEQCRSVPKAKPSHSLRTWMNLLPLVTAQRILHLSLPETDNWGFGSRMDLTSLNPDSLTAHEYVWGPKPEPGQSMLLSQESSTRNGVLVIIQPPWVLSSPVLFDFVHTHSLPGFFTVNPIGVRPASAYQDHHRLWAKVYDSCVLNKTRFFVLSSYSHWVFGSFSPGYTTAYVSGVYSSSENEPSVMELLTFWVASSMGLPGAFVTPETTERYYSSPPVVLPPQLLEHSCPLGCGSVNGSEQGPDGVHGCCEMRVRAARALNEQLLMDTIRKYQPAAPPQQLAEGAHPTPNVPPASLPFLSTIDCNPCNINGNYWVGHWLTVLYS
ncbi:hypothetical protein BKA70DRAFT_21694 [Coprinopsis sp. MPI-PUGE-AT-0042]|nr:hypothetical protein BKA70DRAFT_21694 [Coprinopsis sp. MPI-PUGE-AT-0042]